MHSNTKTTHTHIPLLVFMENAFEGVSICLYVHTSHKYLTKFFDGNTVVECVCQYIHYKSNFHTIVIKLNQTELNI